MRVLYANHTSRVSGGELSLLGLLAALPPAVEPAVACPPGELADRLRERGVETFPIRGTDGSLRLHPTRTPTALVEMSVAAVGVHRAAARFGADLVHANSIRAGLISVAPAARGTRPVAVHVRDCLPPGRASELALRVIGRADVVIANSAYTQARLGPAGRRAVVVHNGIDLSPFAADPMSRAATSRRLGLAEGAGPVLAVVAQITPWKGQDDAIRIAAELRHHHPRLQLLLVGSPRFDSAATRHDNSAYLAELRRLVARLGLEANVRLLGQRDDVAAILPLVDVLLAPSWEEPFGRSIIEAMAAGAAVAATSAGGPAEIIVDGRTGLLLPPRQPRLWSEALAALLAAPQRLAAIAAAGREAARRDFGIDRHVAGVLAVYEAVLSRELSIGAAAG